MKIKYLSPLQDKSQKCYVDLWINLEWPKSVGVCKSCLGEGKFCNIINFIRSEMNWNIPLAAKENELFIAVLVWYIRKTVPSQVCYYMQAYTNLYLKQSPNQPSSWPKERLQFGESWVSLPAATHFLLCLLMLCCKLCRCR